MTDTERVMATIKAIRQTKNVTLRDLEEKTGISNGNLSKYERGERIPTFDNISKILKALDKHLEIVDNKKKNS